MVRTCAVGAGPATDLRQDPSREGDDKAVAVGPMVARTWDLSRDARRRLKDDLPGADNDQVVPDLHKGEELGHDGWIAVVHADGNRIGNLFLELGEVCQGQEFVETLARLSEALDRVTRASLDSAVTRIGREYLHWLVPLIVGGDDVTFLADARVALRLLREFLIEFEQSSAEDAVIAQVTKAVRERTTRVPTRPTWSD